MWHKLCQQPAVKKLERRNCLEIFKNNNSPTGPKKKKNTFFILFLSMQSVQMILAAKTHGADRWV